MLSFHYRYLIFVKFIWKQHFYLIKVIIKLKHISGVLLRY